MPGIAIPSDRTTKQQARGYCLNPACRERSEDDRFEFPVDHDHYACPKCGCDQPPTVGLLVLTHLLVADPRGRVRGDNGMRFRLACDAGRAHLATLTNLEAVTGDPKYATCLGCLAEAERRKVITPQGTAVTRSDFAAA